MQFFPFFQVKCRTSERRDILNNNKNGLSRREKLFCVYYSNACGTEQSAIYAGYTKNPYEKGCQLLSRSEIVSEIGKLSKARTGALKSVASAGFEKLAFSKITDAVSLLYMDSPSKKTIENLDLFNVSEIKKGKDGAMEIKFFDRAKALSMLYELKDEKESQTSLFDALNFGAMNLSEGDENDVQAIF